MNRRILLVVVVYFCAVSGFANAQAAGQAAIDWDRARNLHQREQRGERLSPEDQTYLDQAKAARAKGQGPGQQAQRPAQPPRELTGMTPLSDKGAADYKGFTLGLYGDGENAPTAEHAKRAMEAAGKVVPLDADGKPAANGRIVLMSVGMSNTTQEFSRFVQIANGDAARNPKLVIVDAAQGGKAADSWIEKGQPTWQVAERRLAGAKVTAAQVQVIWIKQALIGPGRLGDFPKHAQLLEADLKKIVMVAKERYPNLRMVYLSSRTYGGHATTALNPEPYAYESAFSVQWLIRSQMKGEDKELTDPAMPVLLWGPYLWTDGVKGRAGDSLVWRKEDTREDGTHPSAAGQQKVGELLLNFFKTDGTSKGWFVK